MCAVVISAPNYLDFCFDRGNNAYRCNCHIDRFVPRNWCIYLSLNSIRLACNSTPFIFFTSEGAAASNFSAAVNNIDAIRWVSKNHINTPPPA